MPFVCSVVLTWNGLDDTLRCLEALDGVRYADGDHRVFLVDNASTDGTAAAVRGRFPEVGVRVNVRNLGYAAGCNVGMRMALDAGAEYVWLLNNDVVAAPGALAELVRVAESAPRSGMVGPRVVTPGGVEELGARVDFATARVMPVVEPVPGMSPGVDRAPVDYVWGCAMLVSAQMLREVGLFDERFVAYFEDADLCWRARKAGFMTLAARNAVVWHAGARAAHRRPLWRLRRFAWGRLRFFWKHTPRERRPGAIARTVLREWPLLLAGTFLQGVCGRKWSGVVHE